MSQWVSPVDTLVNGLFGWHLTFLLKFVVAVKDSQGVLLANFLRRVDNLRCCRVALVTDVIADKEDEGNHSESNSEIRRVKYQWAFRRSSRGFFL